MSDPLMTVGLSGGAYADLRVDGDHITLTLRDNSDGLCLEGPARMTPQQAGLLAESILEMETDP